MAAKQGNLEMVKYCVANECPVDDEEACAYAARYGHLECLKYLREEVKAPWDSETAEWAAQKGHLHILEYLVERKYDQYTRLACERAAKNGHLDCLKYLHETAKAPWDVWAVRFAHENNHPECVQYLLDNNCPLPTVGDTNMELYMHLRSKTYIHKERVKQRERYKTRVIRAPRLKIYSTKVLPPLFSSSLPLLHKNLGKLCLRAIYTHTRAGRIAAYKSPNC